MTTTIFYLSVKAVSATYILYKVWNMIFSQRMYDFWNMLHNWARIARIRLWKYRKKRMEEKARKDRRKARKQRPMLQKVQSEEQAFQPSSYSDLEAQAIVEELAKRFEDTSQDETLMSPVEEKPKPKIKPMVFDDPNEVMGKSNIIYYEDPEVARKTPTRQKRLSQEDMKELMSSESIPDPEFSGACTFEELGNVADVLLNRTTDKEKIMDAAETLYKLQDSDIYHFYTASISTEKQVDRLLKDNLDGAGRRLNGMQSERIAVDWNKFM